MTQEPEVLRLSDGATQVDVTTAGGCIAAYWTETGTRRLNWLRATAPEAIALRDPLLTGCYPLVPFSNRIRDGRFRSGRHTVVLPPNMPGCRHAIHGQGWQQTWHVTGHSATTLSLTYTHLPDAWPFDYEAWQRFTLAGAQLSVEIGLRNTGSDPMPAGIGLHPYFERDPGLRLTAQVDGVWLGDAEVLPTEHAAPPPAAMDLTPGPRVDDLALDNCFTGWDRRACLEWPERRASLTIAATPPLDFLVVYSPPTRHCLCVEPVSHVIDAINLAARGVSGTGAREIAPGETLVGTVIFTPEY